MLAQNFKTPTDLGITDAEFDALAKVLGMLERGEIPHDPKPVEIAGFREVLPTKFSLAHWRCGTAACLGGWAEHIGGICIRRREKGDGIDRLFYPDDYTDEIGSGLPKMRAVTPSQAAIALRSYLTNAAPRWAEALAT